MLIKRPLTLPASDTTRERRQLYFLMAAGSQVLDATGWGIKSSGMDSTRYH